MIKISDRTKLLISNIVGAGVARGINMLMTLFIVPLTINAVPAEVYSIIAVAVSLSIIASYADLGLGLLIINAVAQADINKSSKHTIHSINLVWSFLWWVTIGILIIIILIISSSYLLGVSEIDFTVLFGFSLVVLGIPAGISQRVMFARQRNNLASFWSTTGKLASLLCVYLLTRNDKVDVNLLVFSILGVPVIFSWLAHFFIFRVTELSYFSPEFERLNFRELHNKIKSGIQFLLLTTAPFVEMGVDVLLLNSTNHKNLIPAYDVHVKLFTYLPALVSIFIMPLWPALTAAISSGDVKWAKKVGVKTISYVFLFAACLGAVLFYMSDILIFWWINKSLELSAVLVFGLVAMSVFSCVASVQSAILNGYNIISSQFLVYFNFSIALLVVKYCALLFFSPEVMIVLACLISLVRLLCLQKLIRGVC